jgi:hypothetical protein
MNVGEAPLLLTETKDPTEGHIVYTIVSSLSHPMYLIYNKVTVVGGMKLG